MNGEGFNSTSQGIRESILHGQPFHSALADALDDQSHPLAEVVRGGYEPIAHWPDPVKQHIIHLNNDKESQLRVHEMRDGIHLSWFFRNPSRSWSESPYQSYGKNMTHPEFQQFVEQWPDARVKAELEKHVRPVAPMKLSKDPLLDFSTFPEGDEPASKRARAPIDPDKYVAKQKMAHGLAQGAQQGVEGGYQNLEDDSHGNQHILYDPKDENSLTGVTDPDGTVAIHHYTDVAGQPSSLLLDPSRIGENRWSKAELKASRYPKTFFYTNPADRESMLEGKTHYATRVDAKKIYDLTADPKRIVSRIAARGGFHIDKALSVLERLGYHGVFYSGSFPTVAMLRPTKVRKVEERGPVKLQLNSSPQVGPIHHDMPGGRVSFTRTRGPQGVHWVVEHAESGTKKVMPGPQFVKWVNGFPDEHKRAIFSVLQDALRTHTGLDHNMRTLDRMKKTRLARGFVVGNKLYAPNIGVNLNDAVDIDHNESTGQALDAGALAHEQARKATEDTKDYFHGQQTNPHRPFVESRWKASVIFPYGHPYYATVHTQIAKELREAQKKRPDDEAIANDIELHQNAANMHQTAHEVLSHRLAHGLIGKHEARFASQLARDASLGAPAPVPNSFRNYPGPYPDSAYHKKLAEYYRHQAVNGRTADGHRLTTARRELERVASLHDTAAKVLKMVEKPEPKPTRLARSGYGYCFECKAPFIKHDKAKQMVYCPNGHKRRYLGRVKKLAAAPESYMDIGHHYSDYKEGDEQSWAKTRGRMIITGEGLAIHVHPDDLHDRMSRHADFMGRIDHRKKAISVNTVLGNATDLRSTVSELRQRFPGYQIFGSHFDEGEHKLVRLAALRAPAGGAIINNQFHQGGQILPRAFKRIARVVRNWGARRKQIKLALHTLSKDPEGERKKDEQAAQVKRDAPQRPALQHFDAVKGRAIGHYRLVKELRAARKPTLARVAMALYQRGVNKATALGEKYGVNYDRSVPEDYEGAKKELLAIAQQLKNPPLKLAALRGYYPFQDRAKGSESEGYITPDGTFHSLQPADDSKHVNLAYRLFPESRKTGTDPRRDAEAAGFMHVAHYRSTEGSGGYVSIHGYHPEAKFTPRQIAKLKELGRNIGAREISVDGAGKSRKVRLKRKKADGQVKLSGPEAIKFVMAHHDNMARAYKDISEGLMAKGHTKLATLASQLFSYHRRKSMIQSSRLTTVGSLIGENSPSYNSAMRAEKATPTRQHYQRARKQLVGLAKRLGSPKPTQLKLARSGTQSNAVSKPTPGHPSNGSGS